MESSRSGCNPQNILLYPGSVILETNLIFHFPPKNLSPINLLGKFLRTKTLTAHHILQRTDYALKNIYIYLCLIQPFFVINIAIVLKEIETFRTLSLTIYLISKLPCLLGPYVYLFVIGTYFFYLDISHPLFHSFLSWIIIFIFVFSMQKLLSQGSFPYWHTSLSR